MLWIRRTGNKEVHSTIESNDYSEMAYFPPSLTNIEQTRIAEFKERFDSVLKEKRNTHVVDFVVKLINYLRYRGQLGLLVSSMLPKSVTEFDDSSLNRDWSGFPLKNGISFSFDIGMKSGDDRQHSDSGQHPGWLRGEAWCHKVLSTSCAGATPPVSAAVVSLHCIMN